VTVPAHAGQIAVTADDDQYAALYSRRTGLYGGILDDIERCGYQILDHRARMSRLRKAVVFGRELAAATRSARSERRGSVGLPGT
jgi:hypothetical protein